MKIKRRRWKQSERWGWRGQAGTVETHPDCYQIRHPGLRSRIGSNKNRVDRKGLNEGIIKHNIYWINTQTQIDQIDRNR